jgi:hypothetical protein
MALHTNDRYWAYFTQIKHQTTLESQLQAEHSIRSTRFSSRLCTQCDALNERLCRSESAEKAHSRFLKSMIETKTLNQPNNR